MSYQANHFEINSFLAHANELIEKGFTIAAIVSNEMKAPNESAIAAKRVFTYNPNSKAMLDLFPKFSPLIQTISNLLDQNTKRISKEDPDPNCWVTLGHGYLVIGDFPNAFSAYARAQRVLPNNPDPFFWYAIGIVYHHYNYKEHANSCFSRVLTEGVEFPYYSDLIFRCAILARSNNNFSEAINFFNKSLQSPPNGLVEADILFQIGYTYQLMGNLNNANSIYQRLYIEYPQSIAATEQFVWFSYLNKLPNSSSQINQIIQTALQEHSDEPNLIILNARIAMKEGSTGLAYKYYKESIPYWSENPDFWCALGCLYYKNEQNADAIIAFQRALYLKGDLENAWLNLGLIYEPTNDQTALQVYTRAKQLCESSKELDKRIANLKRGVRTPTSQIIDVDDSCFFEDAPKKFASTYIYAVPILPATLFGKEAEGLSFDELSTFPKSLFI